MTRRARRTAVLLAVGLTVALSPGPLGTEVGAQRDVLRVGLVGHAEDLSEGECSFRLPGALEPAGERVLQCATSDSRRLRVRAIASAVPIATMR